MEEDRYQKTHTPFILGLLSLVLALTLFAFFLYLLPHTLFSWQYNVPEFILDWREWLEYKYNFTEPVASKYILFLFFGLAMIFTIIAYIASHLIDNQLLPHEMGDMNKPVKFKKNGREALNLGLKIFVIIIIVFILGALFEWLIFDPATQPGSNVGSDMSRLRSNNFNGA